MAEKQAAHRQSLEATKLRGDLGNERLGTWLGFVLTLFVSGGGVGLLAYGHQISGLAALLTPLAGLGGIFIWGRLRNEQQLKQKADTVDKAMGQTPPLSPR